MMTSQTNKIFFDTDCLSAFLWVNNESLLPILYPGKIVIPEQVYVELSNPRVSHLKNRIDELVKAKKVTIQEIDISSDEYQIYYKLTEAPDSGHKIIGNGEAASIALAKRYNGIVASNNLKDIQIYIDEFNLQHKTTGDILVEAYNLKLITEEKGNYIWEQMINKRRKLGANTFSEYLKNKG